jgi:hypothetical protein
MIDIVRPIPDLAVRKLGLLWLIIRKAAVAPRMFVIRRKPPVVRQRPPVKRGKGRESPVGRRAGIVH